MTSEYTVNGNRNLYIDFLKVIAIIFIIITHDPWSVSNGKLPLFVFVVDMAVPIFMIVSGYNYANGKHGVIKDEYKLCHILKRLKRFLLPYIIVVFGEVVLLLVIKNKEYTVAALLLDIVKGGYGPGAYYTPIMFQFVFLVPILWYIYNRYGIYSIFIINLFYELLYTIMGFSEGIYQFCFIRYLFLVSLGFEMKKREDKENKLIAILFVIGFCYLISTSYLYEPIIFKRWTTTSMMSGLYLGPILLIGRKLFDKSGIQSKRNNILIFTSNATFHIYLVQMVYYYIGVQRIFGGMPTSIRICLSVLVCLFCGNIFYGVMNKIKSVGVK